MSLSLALLSAHSPTMMMADMHPKTVPALQKLAADFQEVDAILVTSSHWLIQDGFAANAATRPAYIQDYYGFPPDYYQVRYESPGDVELASAVVQAAQAEGLSAATTLDWGLDHGHWTPLLWLRPAADIPVVPLSISHLSPSDHVRWGRAIRRAAEADGRRIAFIASGSLTHRIDMVTWGCNEPFPEGERFDRAVIDILTTGRWGDLDTFDPALAREAAPEGGWGPLFTLRGVMGEEARGELVSYERQFTAASLATVLFRIEDGAGEGSGPAR